MQTRAGLWGSLCYAPRGSATDKSHLSSPFFHPENPSGTGCASLRHQKHKYSIQGAAASSSAEAFYPDQYFHINSYSYSYIHRHVEAPYWHLGSLYRPSIICNHSLKLLQLCGASCWIGTNPLLPMRICTKTSGSITLPRNRLTRSDITSIPTPANSRHRLSCAHLLTQQQCICVLNPVSHPTGWQALRNAQVSINKYWTTDTPQAAVKPQAFSFPWVHDF